MRKTFHFTRHAKGKYDLVAKAGFKVSQYQVKKTVRKPDKIELRYDGTEIASLILNERHILRVVYRRERDIIIIITFYPARRKDYGI